MTMGPSTLGDHLGPTTVIVGLLVTVCGPHGSRLGGDVHPGEYSGGLRGGWRPAAKRILAGGRRDFGPITSLPNRLHHAHIEVIETGRPVQQRAHLLGVPAGYGVI